MLHLLIQSKSQGGSLGGHIMCRTEKPESPESHVRLGLGKISPWVRVRWVMFWFKLSQNWMLNCKIFTKNKTGCICMYGYFGGQKYIASVHCITVFATCLLC